MAFSYRLFQKTLFFFLIALNFFYRILYVRFFLSLLVIRIQKFIAFLSSLAMIKCPGEIRKYLMENERRGHGRSQGGTRATTLRVCFELSK